MDVFNNPSHREVLMVSDSVDPFLLDVFPNVTFFSSSPLTFLLLHGQLYSGPSSSPVPYMLVFPKALSWTLLSLATLSLGKRTLSHGLTYLPRAGACETHISVWSTSLPSSQTPVLGWDHYIQTSPRHPSLSQRHLPLNMYPSEFILLSKPAVSCIPIHSLNT